jgi:hypothetical protein
MVVVQSQAKLLQLVGTRHPRAASRADWTAGKSNATSTPMMAITTSNSTSVKALRHEVPVADRLELMVHLREETAR